MRILIVEDDIALCEAIRFHLKNEGYIVDICNDGEDASYYINQNAYDLIILDRMLPYINGLDILKHARSDGIVTPILMMTALNAIGDKVEGLDAGADDYIVKPFATAELLARIRALSRRPPKWEDSNYITYGDIILDTISHSLKGPNSSFSLSKRETQLFEIFIKNPEKTISRNVIFAHVWGADNIVEEGNLDNYIYFLRRRLNTIGSNLQIKTIRSVGYCLEKKQC